MMCTIRVELHGATRAEYDNLAQDLSRNGIIDVITSDSGKLYKLSPGEYNYHGPATLDQVWSAAHNCAAFVGKPYAVTAAEVSRWKWIGLGAG
jgi:hypothetical protein